MDNKLGNNTLDQKKIYRIIDANFNRAKEGLRVCEDICRFIYDTKADTRTYKLIRHRLTDILSSLEIDKVIDSRNVSGDVGQQSVEIEFKRNDIKDIFYANSQRIKESIRVLEEFTKLFPTQKISSSKAQRGSAKFGNNIAQNLKIIRYKIYVLEKKIVSKC